MHAFASLSVPQTTHRQPLPQLLHLLLQCHKRPALCHQLLLRLAAAALVLAHLVLQQLREQAATQSLGGSCRGAWWGGGVGCHGVCRGLRHRRCSAAWPIKDQQPFWAAVGHRLMERQALNKLPLSAQALPCYPQPGYAAAAEAAPAQTPGTRPEWLAAPVRESRGGATTAQEVGVAAD